MALKVYRMAVVGCPRSILDPNKLEIGVGKSCFCCRFIKPEAYAEEHPFAISDEQWNGPTVNRDQFLYWGAVSRTLPGLQRARFQVVEHTEFVNNSSYHPYPCYEDYITRVVDSAVTSEGKIAYKGQSRKYQPSPPAIYGRSSLGAHQTSTQIFPSEDFRANGIAGYVCIYDPTVPFETGAMKRQLDFLYMLLKALNRSKRRCILVCTKCDAAKEDSIQMGQKLVAAFKKNILFIECSARENVNINEAFFSLALTCKKKYFSRGSQLGIRSLPYKDACNSKKREKNQIINTYKTMLWKKVKSFDMTWEMAQSELQNEIDYPLIAEIAGVDIMRKLFCLRLMELKVEEASKKFGQRASVSDSLKKEQSKDYQEFLSSAFAEHPDLGNNAMQHYAPSSSSICESVSSYQGDCLGPLPISPEKQDNCFSDPDSHCESEDFLDDTGDELEAANSEPLLDIVDKAVTARSDVKVLSKPSRSFSAAVQSSYHMPKKGSFAAKSNLLVMDQPLSRSEEQLWKRSKTMSYLVQRQQRYSSDAVLKEDRPPLPPRTYVAPSHDPHRIVSKPLPPLPIDEEEFVPNRKKLSNSLDCLRSPTCTEEASPYLSPIDLNLQMMQGRSMKCPSPSSHSANRPPLPDIPVELPHRGNASIVRSQTQYHPGRKYGHKRSRSSNCDFLKSKPKDEKPYQKDTRNFSLASYATLRPATFRRGSARASSGSPTESNLDHFNIKRNDSFCHKLKSSKQSLVPDDTDRDSFGIYTRMSPAPPGLEVCSPEYQPKYQCSLVKVPSNSSTDITERASSLPPKRGERRKARRWAAKRSNANSHYSESHWQHQISEGPRYVTHSSSIRINVQNNDDIDSKRMSRDSNIYEHVDEDILEDLRKHHIDDYQLSADTEADPMAGLQPGVFPHPPTAQEWHYFMYMWQLFLQWMKERVPPEVYSIPSNIPANVGDTAPLIVNQNVPEDGDDLHKSTLVENGMRASAVYGTILESCIDSTDIAIVDQLQGTQYCNPCVPDGNGKSVSRVDSGICHSQNDDFNCNGDS